jgi:hypothetical protein
MKMTWRDSATIILAFAAVFLCGYGIGHLVAERRIPPQSLSGEDAPPRWQQETLESLQVSLQLRPDQMEQVKGELSQTARAITSSRDAAILDYHQHINLLYERLIALLDQQQAQKLRKEKKTLEKRIQILLTNKPE